RPGPARMLRPCRAPQRRSAGAPASSLPAALASRGLRERHLVTWDVRAHGQVVDDAAYARALPGIVPRVARLHEVLHLSGEGHHAVLHIDSDAVRIDPGVLLQVRDHRLADLVVDRKSVV